MKKLRLFIVAALFAAAPAVVAQIKYVAVVETELDATSGAAAKMNKAEVRQITAELRSVAVKNLPRDKYNIMTSETVMSQGSAKLEECAEENCVIALGSKIGADYIVRGIVSKFGTSLTLSVEMYETEDGNLVATSGLVRSENTAELLDKAAAVCADMYRTFAATQRSAPKAPAAAPVSYTVTAVANPPHGGAVSRNPNQTYYASGTSVNVMATPAAGYKFAGWSGDASGTANPITVTADGAKTLTANFQYAQRTYTLTTTASPPDGGSVARNPDKEAYTAGERVAITAAPPPKPDAGLAQEPPAKKRHTLAAASLDVVGAGVLLYGYAKNLDVKDKVDAKLYADAEKPESQRNIAYTIGSIILLSGISVHIFF